MTKLILTEGIYIGFDCDLGYIYKLNGSIYSYKSGEINKLEGGFINDSNIQ